MEWGINKYTYIINIYNYVKETTINSGISTYLEPYDSNSCSGRHDSNLSKEQNEITHTVDGRYTHSIAHYDTKCLE